MPIHTWAPLTKYVSSVLAALRCDPAGHGVRLLRPASPPPGSPPTRPPPGYAEHRPPRIRSIADHSSPREPLTPSMPLSSRLCQPMLSHHHPPKPSPETGSTTEATIEVYVCFRTGESAKSARKLRDPMHGMGCGIRGSLPEGEGA